MPPTILPHVDARRLGELQARLESIGRLSLDFLVLLSCSTVIATLGLFQNSVAVIIGAMIIAPLMRPLVALSLSTLTADTILLSRAFVTLLVGTILGVVISATIASSLRSLELTPEILGRTHPTLLDLGVALFAGAIGAYCQTKDKLADSLAGVAIAVALVPPLSVVGIGLAFNSWQIWTGAALLYATNLVGITFAGALVFLVMGFSPLNRAKKGLAISTALSLLLFIPLALSMRELVLENQISVNIKNLLKEKTLTFRGIQLNDVKVKRFQTPVSVVATVLASDQTITSRQVKLVQDFLTREMGFPVEFHLRIIPSREISASDVIEELQPPIVVPAQTLDDRRSSPTQERQIAVPGTVESTEVSSPTEDSSSKEHVHGVNDGGTNLSDPSQDLNVSN